MDKDEQEGSRGCAAVRYIHPVQPAEIWLSPLRSRGQEQCTGHQDNIGRANHLTHILAHKIQPTIVDRWKDKPDDYVQNDQSDDRVITQILFHIRINLYVFGLNLANGLFQATLMFSQS
jgi:hypothetical protein